MSRVLEYLEKLTLEIGPRPVASDTERMAAEWLKDTCADAGLAAEIQDFDTTRHPSTARIVSYLVLVFCVWVINTPFIRQYYVLGWAGWALLVVFSLLAVLDTFGQRGLVAALPKGPSQNVVARSVPSSHRPGEQYTKVVLVAHYDSGLASPLTSEALAWLAGPLHRCANLILMLMPVPALLLVLRLKFMTSARVWLWYALLVICIPSIIVLFNDLIGRIAKRFSPGANTNASGVAAMLSVMETLTAGRGGGSGSSSRSGSTGGGVSASSDSFAAALSPTVPTTHTQNQTSGDTLASASPTPRDGRILDFETVEFGTLSESEKQETVSFTSSFATLENYDAQQTFADGSAQEGAAGLPSGVLDADVIGAPVDAHGFGMPELAEDKQGFFKSLYPRTQEIKKGARCVGKHTE